MGELIQAGATSPWGPGTLGAVLGLAAVGLVALVQVDSGNDDDDSTPGGGLMQPVS